MAKNVDDRPAEFDGQEYAKAVQTLMAKREESAKTNGAIGDQLGKVEEKFGLDRGAINLHVKLKKMSADKRAVFLADFDRGREALGLDEDDEPDMLKESGADVVNITERKKAIGKAVRKAAKTNGAHPAD